MCNRRQIAITALKQAIAGYNKSIHKSSDLDWMDWMDSLTNQPILFDEACKFLKGLGPLGG